MTKRRSVRMVLLLCTLVTSVSLSAQTQTKHAFSIQQAVEYAKKNNVQVKNALLDVLIQKQTNRGITAGALPTLTGSGNTTNYLNIPTTLIPAQFFGGPAGSFEPVQFGTKYISTASLQLQQTLFDGQVFVGLKARSTAMDYEQKNVEVTEEAIKTNIYKAYYQLVLSKTQIDLLDANIERLEKLKHDVSEMFKNGFAENLDIDKVSVQLSNLQTEKQKALNTIDIGYYGLKFLMGMPVKDTLVLTDKITEDDIKSGILTDTSYQYTDRKDFQYLGLLKRLNEFNIKRYQLSYLPVLSFSGTFSKQAQRNTFDFTNSKGDWYTTSFIGFNLSVPIFDGFNKDAKIKQSRLEVQQVQNSIENLKSSIDNEVQQATLNFKTAIITMDYQKKNMKLAENVYEQTRKKFEAGTGSNTEINTAQTDFKTAQTNYINAMYDAIISKIDYLKATGKLQ